MTFNFNDNFPFLLSLVDACKVVPFDKGDCIYGNWYAENLSLEILYWITDI
jgi:hypothetical protein